MVSLMTFIFIVFVILFLLRRWKHPRMYKNYPPGPAKLPFLGSLPFVGLDVNAAYYKLAAKYGKTFSLQLGQDDVVVSSDFGIINKLMKDKRMMGRPSFGWLDSVRYGDHKKSIGMKGLIFSSGEEWTEQREFSVKTLRGFGLGKASMIEMIRDEIGKFKNVLRQDFGKPINLHLLFNISVVNSLWRIITGETLDLDDPRISLIVSQLHKLTKNEDLSPAAFLLPSWIVDLLPQRPFGIPQTVDLFDNVKSLIKPYIDDHKETHDDNTKNDFIDIYIEKMKNAVDANTSFSGNNGEKNMMISILDLFMAGSETTSGILLWTFFFLCYYPNIQDKMRKEISDVVGSRNVQLEDRHNLSYIEAVISEVHRHVSLVALDLPHVATEDVEVEGFLLPAGTQFIAHLYGVHYDPQYWKNPRDFNPARFIDPDGKYHPDPRLIPFGIGKRQCLGQALAQNELFMFITLLIQEFTLSFPAGFCPPEIKEFGDVGFFIGLNHVPPYQVVIQPVI